MCDENQCGSTPAFKAPPIDFEGVMQADYYPPSWTVTIFGVAQCLWNGKYARRGPLPAKLRNMIGPNMAKKEIEETIDRYLAGGRIVIDPDWRNSIDKPWFYVDVGDPIAKLCEKGMRILRKYIMGYDIRNFWKNIKDKFHNR